MSGAQKTRVLVLEDDQALREIMVDELRSRGYEAQPTESIAQAIERLKRGDTDVAILDLVLPDGSGMDVLRFMSEEGLGGEAIVLTGHGTVATAIEAMKLGAYDYLTKPVSMEELEVLASKAAEKARLRHDNILLKAQLERLRPIEGILTQDAGMKSLLEMVDRVAPSEIPVLIHGETGSGKELIARAIHRRSPRGPHPFVAINCGAVSENLIESELFGHERGAFTGAIERKPGLFEVADRGVIFLDEVGDVSQTVQVKLLRAIETGEFLRVGGTRVIRSDLRFVAATHRELRQEVREGRFREDLYHRLNGVTLRLPPLRQRKGDVSLLATHFLERYSASRKKLSRRSIEILESYSWPGNVRELQMVIQRAAILSRGETIESTDLLLEMWNPMSKGVWTDLTLAEVEYQHIQSTLDRYQGHRGKAAKALGIDPKTLYNKLKTTNEQETAPEGEDEAES